MELDYKLDKIFKKSEKTGKIQEWAIGVKKNPTSGTIWVFHGDVGGKIQEDPDEVTEGKNPGKKNETSAYDQACKEAYSKWEKKLKKGYCKTIEDAESGKTDDLIEGGIPAMLAHNYDKAGDKILFPALGQPKLDGIRCIAIKKGTEVTLWTRERRAILSVPHIVEAIAILPILNITLDGELYCHAYKKDFEKITSAVRKSPAKSTDAHRELAKKIEFHIYDIESGVDYLERAKYIKANIEEHGPIKVVKTISVKSDEDVPALFEKFEGEGYEGAMLRNIKGGYEYSRSYNLQKVKKFEDAEFEIVGAEEGRGKLTGLLGSFILKAENGLTFNAKMKGDINETKKYLDNIDHYLGKKLTVQFQGRTKNEIPRFPVGKAVRDYE